MHGLLWMIAQQELANHAEPGWFFQLGAAAVHQLEPI
jgi:hypothetical protein